MRFVRSKLRKREESSHVVNSTEATQPTHVVSTTVEPLGFRQSPSSVWHFPPLEPQPKYIYNANSQVSKTLIFYRKHRQLIYMLAHVTTIFLSILWGFPLCPKPIAVRVK